MLAGRLNILISDIYPVTVAIVSVTYPKLFVILKNEHVSNNQRGQRTDRHIPDGSEG